MKLFALWTDNIFGSPFWEGPFDTVEQARAAVPANAAASVITSPIPMTPAEKREALPILERAR